MTNCGNCGGSMWVEADCFDSLDSESMGGTVRDGEIVPCHLCNAPSWGAWAERLVRKATYRFRPISSPEFVRPMDPLPWPSDKPHTIPFENLLLRAS